VVPFESFGAVFYSPSIVTMAMFCTATDRQAFQAARATARAAITRSRTDAIKQRFDEASGDAAATWRVVRDVLHRDQRQVHSDSQCQTLASGFSKFFIDKLAHIRQSIAASLLQSSGPIFSARMHTGPTLSSLAPTSAAEVLKLLTSRPLKSSPVDVLPSVLLRSCATSFASIISHMANLSFAECSFPTAFKTAQVLPLLKKPGLDNGTKYSLNDQLSADIQPDNHLEGDRTAGARQAAAIPALISELLTTAVSVPARALH